jgi:hypothetical protein
MKKTHTGFILLSLYLTVFSNSGLAGPAVRGSDLIGKVLEGSVSKAPMTAAEVQVMPHACITIGMGRIDGVFWLEGMRKNDTLYLLDLPQNAMAKDAVWFHHYCWGMLSKFRAMTTLDKATRSYENKTWRENMTFIINWVESHNLTWSYMPLIYTERAESYIADKQYVLALADAQKATTLDPSYANAYKVQAEIHRAMGEKKEALQAATEGLKYAPDMKVLQDWYTQLGGKLPYPEPYKAPPSATDEIAIPQAPDQGSAPVNDQPDMPTKPITGNGIQTPSSKSPSENQEENGTKENNNCRFCP